MACRCRDAVPCLNTGFKFIDLEIQFLAVIEQPLQQQAKGAGQLDPGIIYVVRPHALVFDESNQGLPVAHCIANGRGQRRLGRHLGQRAGHPALQFIETGGAFAAGAGAFALHPGVTPARSVHDAPVIKQSVITTERVRVGSWPWMSA